MTDRDALLAAIHDAPLDDAPRLIFADLLDEDGHPERAEFIRIQIAMWREREEAGRVTQRLDELFVRQRELFRLPWADALRSAGMGAIASYSRGWPTAGFSMPAERFPSVGPTLAEYFGRVERLHLNDCPDRLEAVAKVPALAAVRALALGQPWGGSGLRAIDVERWSSSRHLGRLQKLSLCILHERNGVVAAFDPTACEALAAAGFSDLMSLSLSGVRIGDAGLERLLRGPWVATLSNLNLQATGLTNRAAGLLIDSALPDQMDRLFVFESGLQRRAVERLRRRFGRAVNRSVGPVWVW